MIVVVVLSVQLGAQFSLLLDIELFIVRLLILILDNLNLFETYFESIDL